MTISSLPHGGRAGQGHGETRELGGQESRGGRAAALVAGEPGMVTGSVALALDLQGQCSLYSVP